MRRTHPRTPALAVMAILAGLLVGTGGSAGAQPDLCFGEFPTIVAVAGVPTFGTPGDDVIVGTPGPDVINGFDGSDLICSLGGDDTIDGGPGADRIAAGGGRDTVRGAGGNDDLNGGGGPDTIAGGAGHDTIAGRGGADILRGGGGHDDIVGGRGGDTINGNRGVDRCRGNGGANTVRRCNEAVAGTTTPIAAYCTPARIRADLGRDTHVVRDACARGWALTRTCFSGDCLGSTRTLHQLVGRQWTVWTPFPTTRCRQDAVDAGAPAVVLNEINWPQIPC